MLRRKLCTVTELRLKNINEKGLNALCSWRSVFHHLTEKAVLISAWTSANSTHYHISL